mgnify:CR=1 FL=1|tara:strand:+ start:210 stop:485 length:276 start_codon:yes stop_codon:yes gene_type:complete
MSASKQAVAGLLFSEHFNPDLKIVVLDSCPVSGNTNESVLSFANYFHDLDNALRKEILEAFDVDGYYETFTDSSTIRYITTMYPLTDNTRQ